jgi:hypothetical protein
MEYSASQIAGRDEPLRSAIREHLKGQRSRCWRAGCQCATLKMRSRMRTAGCCLSKTAVSQLGERLWEDYQAFAKRDLSEYKIT